MNKKIVALLVTLMFTLTVPFSAMASSSDKVLFMDHMKTQQDKQIQPDFDQPFSGVIEAYVEGEPLGTLGVDNARANIKYEIDMANDQAFFQIDAAAEGTLSQNITMDFYLIDDMLIIPVDSFKAMAKFNPTMEMPADNIKYIYSKTEGFSLKEIKTILNQSNQQEEAMELVNMILEAVPDSCFTARGTTSVMTLDNSAIIDYAKNFQDDVFVSKLAEQIVAFSPEETDKDQIAEDLRASDDISWVTLFKDLKIRKCSTEIGDSTSGIDWDFTYSNEEIIMDCKVTSKSDIQKDNTSSVVNMDLNIKSPVEENNIVVKLDADSMANMKKSSCKSEIKVTGEMEGMKLDLGIKFNIDQVFQETVSFVAPVLTEENSIDAETLKPEIDDMDTEMPISININDYDDYIMFDNAPFIENGHILVPVRELVEYLDGEITWHQPATVKINIADKKIEMNIGETSCMVNGQSITVDNAPVIRDDVTYAPVRFIAEQLGYAVTYDQEYKEVCLNNKSLEE